MNYFDILLAKKLSGGGGSPIDLKEITITENGTVVAPSGEAYNKIITNVPLPQNAYLLKSVANLPQAIASFSDGEDMVMPSLKVAIEPQQDLHGYDSPWVGGAGKNKFGGEFTLSGMSNNNGTFTNSQTDTRTYFSFAVQALNGNTIVGNTSRAVGSTGRTFLAITISSEPTKLAIKHSGSTKDLYVEIPFRQTGTFTLSINVIKYNPSVVGGLEFKDVMLESGSQMTDYLPYSNICPISGFTEANVVVSPTTDAEDGTTYTIQFKDGDNPLTVYGGTLDVVSGVLTVDRASVDLGSLSWSYFDVSSGIYRYQTTINDMKTKNTRSMDIVCSCYKTNIGGGVYDDNTIYNGASPNGIIIVTSSYSNATDFQNSLSGQTAVYELATPLTYQLTPTQVKSLLGSNNVWCDTGDITDAEYFSKETE